MSLTELLPSQVTPPVYTLEQRKMLVDFAHRLTNLCRTIAHDPRMRVEAGAPGSGWSWHGIENRVRFDPKEILERGEAGEDVMKGKIAHEAGHRVITRHFRFIPDHVRQELGFNALNAAVEERPTDQVVRDRYPGAGEWVDIARRTSAVEGHTDDEVREKVGFVPKFSQFCDLSVYAPHLSPEHLTRYDPAVLAFYEEVREVIEDIEHDLPAEDDDEEEIIEVAKSRYKKVYKKLWPRLKEFAKEDLELASLQKMLQAMLLKILATPLGIQLILDAGIPIAMLTEEERKALQKAFDDLTEEQKKAFQDQAKKDLEGVEDEIVKALTSKLSEDPPQTHAQDEADKVEITEEKIRQAQREAEEREEAEARAQIEKKLAVLKPASTIYEGAYQQIQEFDETLYERLEGIFRPSIKKTVKLVSAGSRLNMPAVYRWEADRGAGSRGLTTRIFETVHRPEKRDYAITLLVDLSGSMWGEKIHETFKAVVLLTEVLNRMGIKIEILGFQDEIIRFKEFDEDMTDDTRRRMSGMIQEVEGSNPGGHNQSAYNDDGPCLMDASRRLGKQSAKDKFLVVLSDGQPAGRHSNRDDLHTVVAHILRETDQKLIALGLGKGTEHVKNFYPTSLPSISVKNLPDVLSLLLEDIILYPGKYTSHKK